MPHTRRLGGLDGSDSNVGRRLYAAVALTGLCVIALIAAQPAGAWSTPAPRAAGVAVSAGSSASKPSAAGKRRVPVRKKLTVSLSGRGAGSVTGPRISCPHDCLGRYRAGAKVWLVATPTGGSKFTGWAGACAGTGACRVTMKRARLVTADFNPASTSPPPPPPPPPPPTSHVLNTTVNGAGSVSGSGISCPGDCSQSYTGGTQVTLTATAGAGNHLASWNGACSGSGGTCRVTMDAAKSVGADFAGDPPPPPPPPPATDGITTTPVDGGPDYYSHFSNPLPSGPSYFPIMAWLRPVLDQSYIDRYKDFGLTGLVGVENPEGTQENLLRQAGMHVLVQADERTRFNDLGSETSGWVLADEQDMQLGPTACPSAVNQVKSGLPADGRLRFNGYGKGVLVWETDNEAKCWLQQQDVSAADLYWFTDPGDGQGNRFGYKYGDNVQRLRYLRALGGGSPEPIWMDVELGWPFTEGAAQGGRRILPEECRSAVWHSIIAGARGIIYFDHNFGPGTPGATITNNGYPDTRAMMKSVNAQITALAPVLNSPTITSGVSASGPIRWLGKLTSGGQVYIFAGATTGAASATFRVPSGTTAEAVGEGRSIPITSGTFTDSFADKNAIHIYKVGG